MGLSRSQRDIEQRLEFLSSKISNSEIRIRESDTPYVLIDNRYSVCFFRNKKIYKVWINYNDNTCSQIAVFVRAKEVINYIEELRGI